MPVDYAGNTLQSARAIALGSALKTYRDYVGTGDVVDYYRFRFLNRSSINATLDRLTANANVQLLNASGRAIRSSVKTGTSAEAISMTLGAGTYYLKVYRGTNSASTSYALNLATTGYQRYTYKYSYGNGDYYTGYGYSQLGRYFPGQSLADSYNNETGYYGSYRITGATNYVGSTNYYLNSTYVTSYYNNEDASSRTPYSGYGSTGLGSEYGYLTSNQDYTNDYFGGRYFEADTTATTTSLYYFTYNYGNGDFYEGHGYTSNTNYYTGQYFYDNSANETGYTGYYYIRSVEGGYSIDNQNQVYVTNYYNGESGVYYTPYSGYGNAGLGSEYGYLTRTQDFASDYFGGRYYEADPPNTYLYYFTYSYGNGDSYTGYGYTNSTSYYSGLRLTDSSTNETGYVGSYSINSVYDYPSADVSNQVYITSYYNSENSTSYTPYYGYGESGLGSEYGYLTSAQSYTNDYFGSRYYEADVSSNLYYFTYNYGNGDYYTGHGYTADSSYYSGKYLYDSSTNETGYQGYYYISSVYSGYDPGYNKQVYVDGYYNSEISTFYTPYSASGSNGLGSEYGYLTSNYGSGEYFGGRYYEADLSGYQYYTFKYTYGNGDYYTGSGYANYNQYSYNQYVNDSSANETGYYGYYQITGTTNYTGSTSYLNQVYVNSYYNTESNAFYTPNSASGSSGLGSEYGYLSSGYSNTYFGGKYYEADYGYQYYTFKYAYGNGDYYTGYGYTDYNQYSTNQYIYNASTNEVGYTGYYQITGTSNYSSNTSSLNQVYVTGYYNTENSTSYTPYSGYSSVGLGSESGYVISNDNNSYFSTYYEADITTVTTIDLKGSSFSLNSTSLTAGNTFTASFGVQNTGSGSAGSFYIKFYLSTDSTITSSDKFLDSYTIASLSGSSSTGTLSKTLTLPGATDAFWSGSKTYYIGMIVDANSNVSESNETNNASTGLGLDYKDAYVTIPTTSLVTFNNLSFSGKEGDAGTLTLSLNQAISSNVTLTFNGGRFLTIDADGSISNGTQNTITFTSSDWYQSRTIKFFAENDDTSANRSSGNTIGYSLSGGLTSSGSYDLGSILNTYAPDTSRFNIDLDFRNDTLNFWTVARQAIAQKAATDWANVIANELSGKTLINESLSMVGVNGLSAFTFTTNRYIDDIVIFVGSYNGGDGAGGWGGSLLGGWSTTDPLPRAGNFTVNAQEAVNYSDAELYSVFCHELGHTLGLLGQNITSSNLIDSTNPQTAVFKGAYARAANGGAYIPLQAQDGPNPVTGRYDYSHPSNNVYSMMSYGYTYQLSAPTSLDFAMLADCGYLVKGVNA